MKGVSLSNIIIMLHGRMLLRRIFCKISNSELLTSKRENIVSLDMIFRNFNCLLSSFVVILISLVVCIELVDDQPDIIFFLGVHKNRLEVIRE